jgi:hypothetical protein
MKQEYFETDFNRVNKRNIVFALIFNINMFYSCPKDIVEFN